MALTLENKITETSALPPPMNVGGRRRLETARARWDRERRCCQSPDCRWFRSWGDAGAHRAHRGAEC